jgi:hypothetical protein
VSWRAAPRGLLVTARLTARRMEAAGGACSAAAPQRQRQRGFVQRCIAHGGGKRCQEEGFPKSAFGGGTQRCKAHGGGKRCQEEGCLKSA